MDNPLMPPGLSPPTPQSAPGPVDSVSKVHGVAQARLAKTTEASNLLGDIHSELSKLSDLGDTVTQDDIVKSAGKLVAAGIPPNTLASLLSDMPAEGPGLGVWVQDHLATITQRQAQLAPIHAIAGHDVGVAALHGIAAHTGAAQSNPLMPSGAPNA